MKKNLFGKVVLIFSIAVFTTSAFAGFWDWSRPYRGPKKDIITLGMVSNYDKAVLMADLIQNENKQPYIRLPKIEGGKIFFCPARKTQPSLEILPEDLTRFISFLNPKQIIILGSEQYVPKSYAGMIPKNINVVRFYNGKDDWILLSQTVADFLDVPNMPVYYKRLYKKIQNKLYKPTALTQKPENALKTEKLDDTKKADAGKATEEIVIEEKVVEKVVDSKAKTAAPVIVKE